ncbi:MAG TPA: NYN domain-containing protein, partial [Microthrixaceae bacterium]|nr:NYN domain-containing protein [Microthrixaceae bacterium]
FAMNVSMSAWPRLDARTQRDHLVKLLGAASARTGADVHVVFDGDSATEAERRPSVSAPLAVRVHYSAADVEADDVVIAMARDLPTDRPVVVVSSDRRVAEGARRHGANVVSSSALLAWVRA